MTTLSNSVAAKETKLGLIFHMKYQGLIGPRRDKTCLRGFRQSEIQTSLLSYRD